MPACANHSNYGWTYSHKQTLMNTFKIILSVISCLLMMSCTGNQIKENGEVSPYSAQGWGGTTCQQLIADITPEKVGFEQAVSNINAYQAWLSGFVSGVNYATEDAYDVSGATEPEESFIWLKEYCDQHHQTTVPQALHTLLEQWEKEGKLITYPK